MTGGHVFLSRRLTDEELEDRRQAISGGKEDMQKRRRYQLEIDLHENIKRCQEQTNKHYSAVKVFVTFGELAPPTHSVQRLTSCPLGFD